jgi:hypothetical protein
LLAARPRRVRAARRLAVCRYVLHKGGTGRLACVLVKAGIFGYGLSNTGPGRAAICQLCFHRGLYVRAAVYGAVGYTSWARGLPRSHRRVYAFVSRRRTRFRKEQPRTARVDLLVVCVMRLQLGVRQWCCPGWIGGTQACMRVHIFLIGACERCFFPPAGC